MHRLALIMLLFLIDKAGSYLYSGATLHFVCEKRANRITLQKAAEQNVRNIKPFEGARFKHFLKALIGIISLILQLSILLFPMRLL